MTVEAAAPSSVHVVLVSRLELPLMTRLAASRSADNSLLALEPVLPMFSAPLPALTVLPAAMTTLPVPLAVLTVLSLAVNVMPALVETVRLTLMSPPARRISVPVPEIDVRPAASSVIVCRASSVTVPLSRAFKAPKVMKLSVVLVKSANRMLLVRSPAVPSIAPPVSRTVMLRGSSSNLPATPAGAATSTLPTKSSTSLPETSTLPPSPAAAPPRALMAPWNRVAPSAHSTTWPPWPACVASARTCEPGRAATICELRSDTSPP